jgi:hypothetical protein
MKKHHLSIVSLILLLFFACRKEPAVQPGNPGPGDNSTLRAFRITLQNLPDQPNVFDDLKALVTIRNSQNAIVAANKIVPVTYNQNYVTDTIQLTKGDYTITGLVIRQHDNVTRFASPVAGSAKAALVTKPLAVSIKLDEKAEKNFSIEVLKVGKPDTPESFGYPAGSFGNIPDEPETPTEKRIFLRPLIKIGDVVYDSVPVHLVLKSWDAQNNMTYASLALPAGLQPVQLPAGAVRYQLSISKWGTHDELTLDRDQVQPNTVYVMGGAREAKKLKTVFEAKLVNGKSTPQTKTDYEYDANGRVQQRTIWGKREDMSTYLVRKDKFEYQNSKITAIRGYDEKNALVATSSFGYDSEGKLTSVQELADNQEIKGTVHYLPLEGSSGISHDYRIEVGYTNSATYYTTTYSKDMHGGNMIADVLATSHGSRVAGLYGYDFSINPFVHLAIPDIYLGHISKHNKTYESKDWSSIYPEVEPIDYRYVYDADGYPTELYTRYRNYQTKAEVFTIRTVFVY